MVSNVKKKIEVKSLCMKNFQLCSGCFYFVFNVSNADITRRMTDISVVFERYSKTEEKYLFKQIPGKCSW